MRCSCLSGDRHSPRPLLFLPLNPVTIGHSRLVRSTAEDVAKVVRGLHDSSRARIKKLRDERTLFDLPVNQSSGSALEPLPSPPLAPRKPTPLPSLGVVATGEAAQAGYNVMALAQYSKHK